jgi:ribosome maturation factor RimP
VGVAHSFGYKSGVFLMSKVDLETLKKDLETFVDSLGFELADISAPVVGGRLTLRLFVHSPDGVTLDDCAHISRSVSEKLDTDDPIHSRYTLEVSSLGLDRPLVTVRDYQRRIGETVKLTFKENGKKVSVKGILKSANEKTIEIDDRKEILSVPVEANPRGKIVI